MEKIEKLWFFYSTTNICSRLFNSSILLTNSEFLKECKNFWKCQIVNGICITWINYQKSFATFWFIKKSMIISCDLVSQYKAQV